MIGLANLAMLVGLVSFAYAGTFARFWADDYCYSATVKSFGWLQGTLQWFLTSGNRFSTITPVALSDLFGMRAVEFLPALVLVIWVLAWVFFLAQVSRLAGKHLPALWISLVALFFVFFSVLLAPDRLQTIYWRMGTLHYTFPIPILLFNAGFILWSMRRMTREAAWVGVVSGLLALFTAGFSETFAALQAGLFFMAIALTLVFLPAGQRQRWSLAFLAPLIGTIAAMAIMLLSPSNIWRSAAAPPPDNLLLIVPYSLRYAADFLFYTVRGQLVPFIVFLLGVSALAWLAYWGDSPALPPKSAVFGIVGSLAAAYLLVVFSFAPSAYAGLQYPAGRAMMPALFIFLVGLSVSMFFLVGLLRHLVSPRLSSWGAFAMLVVLFGCSLYVLRATGIARQDVARLSTWSVRWDARDIQIRQQLAANQPDVRVQQIEVVRTIEDIGPDTSFWINACAAAVYGAHSIQANP